MQYKNKQFIRCSIHFFLKSLKKIITILTFQFLCKVVLTMQNHFEETTRMEAGI